METFTKPMYDTEDKNNTIFNVLNYLKNFCFWMQSRYFLQAALKSLECFEQ